MGIPIALQYTLDTKRHLEYTISEIIEKKAGFELRKLQKYRFLARGDPPVHLRPDPNAQCNSLKISDLKIY